MASSQAHGGQSAGEIRGKFASFLASLPGKQSPPPTAAQQNGVDEFQISRVRQILNRKKELAEFDAKTVPTTLVISRQVQSFNEALQKGQAEIKALSAENARFAGQLDQINTQSAFLRQENERLRTEHSAALFELKGQLKAKDEELNGLKLKLAKLEPAEAAKESRGDEAEGLVERFQREVQQYRLEVERLKSDKPAVADPALLTEVTVQRAEIDKLKRTLAQSTAELTAKSSLLEQRSVEVKSAKESLEALQKLAQSLRADKQRQSDESGRQVAELAKEGESLRAQLAEARATAAKVGQMGDQLRTTQEDIIRSKNESRDALEKLNFEKTTNAKLLSDLAIRNKELEYATQSAVSGAEELKGLKLRVGQLEQEKAKALESAGLAHQKTVQQLDALSAELREAVGRAEKLELENQRLEKTAADAKRETEAANEAVRIAQKRLQAASEQRTAGQSEHQSDPQVAQLLKQNRDLEESNEELINKLSEYQTTIDRLALDVQKSSEQAVEAELSAKQKIQEFINAYNENNPSNINDLNVDYMNDLCSENNELKAYVEELETRLKELSAANEALESERAALLEEVETVKEYAESIQRAEERKEETQARDREQFEQLEQLAEAAEARQQEVEAKEMEVAGLQGEVRRFEAELRACQEKVGHLTAENTQLLAANKALESRLSSAGEQLKRNEERLAEFAGREAGERAFEEEVARIRADNERRVSQLSHEIAKLSDKVEEKTRELAAVRERAEADRARELSLVEKPSADQLRVKELEGLVERLTDELSSIDYLKAELAKKDAAVAQLESQAQELREGAERAVRSDGLLTAYATELSLLVQKLIGEAQATAAERALEPNGLLQAERPLAVLRSQFAEIENRLVQVFGEEERLRAEVESLRVARPGTEADEPPELRISDMMVGDVKGEEVAALREELGQKDATIEELNQRLVLLSGKFKETSDEYFEKLKAFMEPLKESPELGVEIGNIEQLFEEVVNTYDNEVTQDEFKYVMTTIKLAIDQFIQKVYQAFEEQRKEGPGEELAAQANEIAEHNKELETLVQERDEKIRELEEDLDNLIGACEDLKTESEYLRGDKQKLEAQLAAKPGKTADIVADYKGEIEKLRADLREAAKRHREAEAERKKLEAELGQKEEELEAINQQVQKAFDDTKEEYEEKVEQLESQLEEMRKGGAGGAGSGVKAGDPEHQQLAAEYEELNNLLHEINEEKELLEQHVAERDARIEELEAELEKLKSRKSGIEVGKQSVGFPKKR